MNEEKKQTALVVASSKAVQPASVKRSYWSRAAGLYSHAFRVFLIALALFLVLFTVLNFRVFSYENLFYFFKDLQALSSHGTASDTTIFYNYEGERSTVLSFGGGIAFVSEQGVEIYAADGERLLDAEQPFAQPRAVASRKYVLVFDGGGKSFAVCNAHAKLHRGETEHPILAAAVSDSGHFALITSSDQALSQVLLYDSNFNLIQRFSRASATVGVDVSPNGKWIALLGATEQDGNVATLLDVYRIGSVNASGSARLAGEFPLALSFTNSSSMAVLTDTSVRVFDADGDERNAHLLNGAIPVAFEASEEGILLALETDRLSASYRVLAFNKRGKITLDAAHTGNITDLALTKDDAFLLGADTLTRLSLKDGTAQTLSCEKGATGCFAVSGDRVRVIYPAKVQAYTFDPS